MAFETQVIQDVKDFLLDELDQYAGCSESPYGSEVYYLLMSEPNTNGTLDFNRAESLEYLNAHRETLDSYLEYAIDESRLDFEDVYEWDESEEEYTYDEYVETDAESIKVAIYIYVAEAVLTLCPSIEKRRDEPFDMNDTELVQALKEELRLVNCAEVANLC